MARTPAPLKLAAGFMLLFVGAVLSIPGVPGPGLPIAVVGLVLLSERFRWAKRLLEWGKHKLKRIGRKSAREGHGAPPGNGDGPIRE